MALIQHVESAGSPEKSAGRAALNSGVDDNIGVGGLGGTGLLGVDCLLMPKGQVGTVGVNNVGICKAGVKGLIFLVTRVWVGREAPLGIVVGNV